MKHPFLFVTIWLLFFPLCLQAQSVVIKSKPERVNYVPLGDTLRLAVTYDYNGTVAVTVSWEIDGVGKVSKKGNEATQSLDPRITIEGQATLVVKNTTMSDNATFTIKFTGLGIRSINEPFQVIVLAPPKVEITCSDSCLCEGLDGSPPAWVSWLKDGKIISGSGYQQKSLLLEDMRKNGQGEYTCNATSYNLTVVKNITVAAPVITSFKSDKNENIASVGEAVVITCQASDNPSPKYTILFDGSAVANKTEYTISKVSRDDAGNYICLAKNFFGEATQSFHLNVTGQTKTTSSEPTSNGNGGNGETSNGGNGGSSGGLSGGAVAGIVIGVLALIVVVIFVVWCVWFKGEGKRGGREPSPSRDTAGPAGEENAYASVDKDKERAPASNPGPSSTNPPGGGGSSLPPVYSTVDKTKKTKKPPADAQPTSVTYASLDPVALQPDSSRMHERDHQPTNYASIDLERLQGDLV